MYPCWRGVEIIEGFGHDNGRDFRADAVLAPAFLGANNTVGFLDALNHGCCIQRAERAQINDFGVNPLLRQRICGLKGMANHAGMGHNRDVSAFAADFRFANGNQEIIHIRHITRVTVKQFML